jgi:hypothetical protein
MQLETSQLRRVEAREEVAFQEAHEESQPSSHGWHTSSTACLATRK